MMNAHAMAPRMATGQTNGTRNGRGRSGSLTRSTRTPMHDECKGEKRPDVRQIVGFRGVADERCERDGNPGDECRGVRDAPRGMQPRRPLWQQTITCHGKKDPRLSVLEDEQHSRHRDGGTKGHDPSHRPEARKLQRVRKGIGDGKLRVRHHAGEHSADDNVDERADCRPPRMPIGRLRLGSRVSSAAVEMASKPM